ncbi:MAG TPA: ABC transporter ATP-binding protein [Kouleothrix sp.]|uniref:ABC transporter ATP-binding protein n=1 Tax=Kouleothrix sp. TaxID=2779161 RepID=UPI002CBB5403|nr:ABC transporter ATP-binding protein [Kouleothrix sp.]HRC74725.1 ABC transporter ATP-binding protein [Kouleothrix sp.]
MGFVLDGLEAEDYDRNYRDSALVRRIGTYFRPHTRTMAIVAGMVALGTLAETIIPVIISRGIDALAGNPATQLALALGGAVLVLGSLGWFFNFIRQTLAARVVGNVVLKLREDAFAAVIERDMSFYDRFSSGKIVSRVTSDTQDFSNVVTLTIDLISQFLLVLIITIVLFTINVSLALLVLAVTPVVFAAALSFRRIARWSTQRGQRATAEVNAAIQETVSGIAVAKSFRQEAAIYDDFRKTNALAYRVRLLRGLVLNTIFPTLDIISGVVTTLVVYYGGRRVLGGTLTSGEWYLFVQTLNIFLYPLTSIASFWSQFQQGLSASERVFALIDAEPRVVQTDAVALPRLRGEIAFEHVSFSYGDPSKQNDQAGEGTIAHATDIDDHHSSFVLRGFDLHIRPGETLAIVGHTGAGKSSLARLITRFYEFQGGRILIDGRDIRTLSLAQYRGQLGLVPQVPFLFSGSVAENIRYGRPNASDADVAQAAHKLGGGEWIDDLPRGLETDVGERGARLSLGQRQLVALARVLLQDPSIFILDEATASIDPFTEAQIQEGLDMIMRQRTSIIIAHRLSTVRAADRIIVMQAGRIIEQGSHDELLARGGHYAELYNAYFRHQSLEYIEQVGAFGHERAPAR